MKVKKKKMDPTRVYVLLTFAQYLEPTQNPLMIAAGFSTACVLVFAEAIECFALYLALCIAVRELAPTTRTYSVWDLASQSVLVFLPTHLPFYICMDASWQDLRKTALFCAACASGWIVSWNPVYATCLLVVMGGGVSLMKKE